MNMLPPSTSHTTTSDPATRADETLCITGASGFVGRHLLASLGAEHPLRALSRDPARLPAHSELTPVRGELSDAAAWDALLVPGATLIHLAYEAGADPAANLAAIDVLVATCRATPPQRVIHLSTAVVVGRVDMAWVDENTQCVPRNPYEQTKLAIEERLLAGLDGICPVTILRPTAVFGPGGRNLVSLVDELARGLQWRGRLKVLLRGAQAFNLVHVDTVVEAVRHLLDHPAPHGSLFIVAEDEAAENSVRGVTRIVCDTLGTPAPLTPEWPGQRWLLSALLRVTRRSKIRPDQRFSSARLTAHGFQPSRPFAESVADFTRWYTTRADRGTR